MASSPGFAATPRCAIAQISSANTLRDGTGTIGTVFTAGASGSRIETVVITATGTTTAGMVRLFVHNGSTAYLLQEVPVYAITPSSTVPSFYAMIGFENGFIIPTGYSLRASTHNAETFNVIALGGDF